MAPELAEVKLEGTGYQQEYNAMLNYMASNHADTEFKAELRISGEHDLVLHQSDTSLEIEEMNLDEIKKELHDCEEHHLMPMKNESVIGTKNIFRYKGKVKSVEHFSNFMQFCEKVARSSERMRFPGPIRLAECPSCTFECKNAPDRLIRLFNHINRYHKKNRNMILKDVLDNYYPLVCFMKRMWMAKS